jgi:hypothetical protein
MAEKEISVGNPGEPSCRRAMLSNRRRPGPIRKSQSSRVLGNFSHHNRRLNSHLRWRRSSPNIGKPKFPRQAILGSKQRALGAHQLRLRKGELPRPRLAALFSLLLSTAATRCHRRCEHAVPPCVELVIAIANSTPAITVARRNIRLLRHIFTRDLVPVLVIDDDVFKMRVFRIGPVRCLGRAESSSGNYGLPA